MWRHVRFDQKIEKKNKCGNAHRVAHVQQAVCVCECECAIDHYWKMQTKVYILRLMCLNKCKKTYKKHPNVVKIETELNCRPSLPSTSNNACAMKCVCARAFVRLHSIAKSQLNQSSFQNPLFLFFSASLRMNCFYSFHSVTFFSVIFHRTLNEWLIFNEYMKKRHSVFWHAHYTWNNGNEFKYAKIWVRKRERETSKKNRIENVTSRKSNSVLL